jgi:NAD(P)-dependent dehydrogenase (short-subunit alcohol dehydrogenase family)
MNSIGEKAILFLCERIILYELILLTSTVRLIVVVLSLVYPSHSIMAEELFGGFGFDPVSEENEASEPPFEDYGFTEAELGTCMKVLECLGTEKGKVLFEEKRMKDFRKKILPFVEGIRSKFPVDQDKLTRRKAAKALRNARKQRQQAQDRRHIDASNLRAQRLKELNALQNEGKPDAATRLLIPDGVSGTSATEVRLLDDGRSDEVEGRDGQLMATRLLTRPRSCYTCKSRFYELHHYYDQLCPPCASLSYGKRLQSADLTGKIAFVTGGRVKIGFQVCLKILRAGAKLIMTSRFPSDAARRYSEEKDFDEWKDRLTIYGLDFRYVPGVERFCDFLCQSLDRLDIIVNNACQTIRRPPSYYKHLLKSETMDVPERQRCILGPALYQKKIEHSNPVVITDDGDNVPLFKDSGKEVANPAAAKSFEGLTAPEMTQVQLMKGDGNTEAFPEGKLDVNQQQIDLRTRNSWLIKLEEVETPELLEVISVNMMAPFIFNSRLKPLMLKAACAASNKFIVNVSAMEGKFYRYKTPNHPHTNMAKAALNMMTRTSSEDYAKCNIFMNSVDTGWINDENPLEKAREIFESNNFQTPIDEIDAAARILDTVMVGSSMELGKCPFGKFYKDFKESEW